HHPYSQVHKGRVCCGSLAKEFRLVPFTRSRWSKMNFKGQGSTAWSATCKNHSQGGAAISNRCLRGYRQQVRKNPAQSGQARLQGVWTFHIRLKSLVVLKTVGESAGFRANLRMRRAIASHVCFSRAVARAAAPRRLRKARSQRNRSKPAARDRELPGGHRSPVSSSRRICASCPMRLATTGSPAAMYS